MLAVQPHHAERKTRHMETRSPPSRKRPESRSALPSIDDPNSFSKKIHIPLSRHHLPRPKIKGGGPGLVAICKDKVLETEMSGLEALQRTRSPILMSVPVPLPCKNL